MKKIINYLIGLYYAECNFHIACQQYGIDSAIIEEVLCSELSKDYKNRHNRPKAIKNILKLSVKSF